MEKQSQTMPYIHCIKTETSLEDSVHALNSTEEKTLVFKSSFIHIMNSKARPPGHESPFCYSLVG